MGCGDGTLLRHLYNIVKQQTLRGKHLDEYPLQIVGADFNKAARLASSITLKEAGIEYSILHVDISDPESYVQSLKDEFGIDLRKMLNFKKFSRKDRLSYDLIYSEFCKCITDNKIKINQSWNSLKSQLTILEEWVKPIEKFENFNITFKT